MSPDVGVLGLMRLASPALPVGGFAYSQGLETAIDAGWLKDSGDIEAWCRGVLDEGLGRLDAPVLIRLYRAVDQPDDFRRWNGFILASRESRELRLEEQQMGRALWRLLRDLEAPLPNLAAPLAHLDMPLPHADKKKREQQPSWLAAFAVAGRHWGLGERQTCLGFLWSWLENQLAVAAKTVPIGQTDVQRISGRMLEAISAAVDTAFELEDGAISGGLPGVTLASMKHETQYSRLFRS